LSRDNFGKLAFKWSCELFFVFFDRPSGRKVLSAKVVYIRGVIYKFLNIGRQIVNRWIHQWVKCTFP